MLQPKNLLIAVALTVAVALSQGVALGANPTEYTIKAAYLSKFGSFVEWPEDTFSEPTSALNLCIVGVDPFGEALDQLVAGQRIDSHPLRVKRIPDITDAADCQIVFIDGNDVPRALKVVSELRGTRVLTVTDTGDETEGAGIINFMVEGNRVRFGVDDKAAKNNGLRISSRLLMLAVYVRGGQ